MSSLVRTALELYAEHRREKSKLKRFLSWLTLLSLSSFFFHPDGMVWIVLQHAHTLLHHTVALAVATNSISVVLCLVVSTLCAGALLHLRHDTRAATLHQRTPSSKKSSKRKDRKARPAVLSPRRAPTSPRVTLASPPLTPKLAEVRMSTTANLPHSPTAHAVVPTPRPVLVKSTPEQRLPEIRPATVVKHRENPRTVRSPKASMPVTNVPKILVTKCTSEKSSSQPRKSATSKREVAPTKEPMIDDARSNNNSNDHCSASNSTTTYANNVCDGKSHHENANNDDVDVSVSASSQPCDEPQREVLLSATDAPQATEANEQPAPEIEEPPTAVLDAKLATHVDEPRAIKVDELLATESNDLPDEAAKELKGATPEIVLPPFTKVQLFAFLAEPKLTVPDIRRHVASGAIDDAMVTAMQPAEFAAAKIPQLVVRMLFITIMSMRPRAVSPPPAFTRSTSAHVAPPPGFAAIGTPPRTYHAPPRSRSFPVTKGPSVQELNHMYERDMERISNQMTMNVLD